MGRCLAVDYGIARIGVAISDDTKIIASPQRTLPATKKVEHNLNTFLKEFEDYKARGYVIDEIVVGMPLRLNGQKGTLSDDVRRFVNKLEEALDLPVIAWDERLTTVQAERSLREGNMNRKKRSKVIDAVTAVIILQSYLDNKGRSLVGI